MTIQEPHFISPLAPAQEDEPMFRLRVPIIPTLLGALALLNVASVVLVLLE
jgi:hypothetical protein